MIAKDPGKMHYYISLVKSNSEGYQWEVTKTYPSSGVDVKEIAGAISYYVNSKD